MQQYASTAQGSAFFNVATEAEVEQKLLREQGAQAMNQSGQNKWKKFGIWKWPKGRGHTREGREQHHMLRPHKRATPTQRATFPEPCNFRTCNTTAGNATRARHHLATPPTQPPAKRRKRGQATKQVGS